MNLSRGQGLALAGVGGVVTLAAVGGLFLVASGARITTDPAPPAALGRAGNASTILVSSSGGARNTRLVDDPQVGMPVLSVEMPAGWRFAGAVAHGGGCMDAPDSVKWAAESPDGQYGVSFSNGLKYGATNQPQANEAARQRGCLYFGSPAVEHFLASVYVPNLRPGARVEAAEPMPDSAPLLRQARAQVAGLAMPPQSEAFSSRLVVNGGMVKIAYIRNGHPVEERIAGLTYCNETRQQNMMGPPLQLLDCTLGPLTVVRAPAGQLEAFEAKEPQMIKVTDNPQYQEKVGQLIMARGAAQRQQMGADFQAQTANTQAEIRERNARIVANGQAGVNYINGIGDASRAAAARSSDALHASSQAFARTMGDQAEYTTPSGQTFTGSNQYSHTYIGPNNMTVQTNSADAPGPSSSWTELQPR